MVGWTKEVGSGQQFYVGFDGDLDENTKAATTFEGVSSAYTSLTSWSNMRYHASKLVDYKAKVDA